MKQKVFCIGFHKTGTKSLKRALIQLGYRVVGPNGVLDPNISTNVHTMVERLVPKYDAFQDNPWPVLYRELDRNYPHSKFILTIRDSDSWIRSQVQHFGATRTPMREWIYGVGCPEGNEESYVETYERHNASVLEYFAKRPGDLLVLDLARGDGWEKLCPFLAAEAPLEPFPHLNKASNRQRRVKSGQAGRTHRGSGSFRLGRGAGRRKAPLRVCAIVLNWNRPNYTVACIDSLLPAMRNQGLVLIVVDNGSTDNSVQLLTEWSRQHFRGTSRSTLPGKGTNIEAADWDFLLVRNSSNAGYAAGNNIGIRIALQRPDLGYIWILNNDTTVRPDTLGHLLRCARRYPKAGAFGSTLVNSDSRNIVQCAGGCRYKPGITIVHQVHGGMHIEAVLASTGTVQLDYVSGASMFCRAEMFRDVGLFDERFFLYFEELDLAYRSRAKGYALHWCKKSVVFHKGGGSTSDDQTWLKEYHENLSTLLFTSKHHPHWLPAAAIFRLFGKSLVYLVRGTTEFYKVMLGAYMRAAKAGRFANFRSDRESVIVDARCTRDVHAEKTRHANNDAPTGR